MATKSELKSWIANYKRQIEDFRNMKKFYQQQIKMCDKSIKSFQSRIVKTREELKNI